MFTRKLTRLTAAGIAAIAIAGGTYGIIGATASSGSGTTTTATAPATPPGAPGLGGRGSNARSGPAAGGTSGTVTSVSASSFTLTTGAGQTVTVKRSSSTTYRKGTAASSASVVKKGTKVLVLGIVNGTTITAGQVVVQTGGTAASSVVPFQRGAPSTAKQAGKIPANYTEGSGTIVSGTKANKATEAALAAYPGGVVDRVVQLSNGEYEVHNIGVNWPHHIFVSQSYKVMGAN